MSISVVDLCVCHARARTCSCFKLFSLKSGLHFGDHVSSQEANTLPINRPTDSRQFHITFTAGISQDTRQISRRETRFSSDTVNFLLKFAKWRACGRHR